MAFHVRDEETDGLVRQLAERTGLGLTDAIREAVREKLERTVREGSFDERLKATQDEFERLCKPSGLPVDKAFYDWLNDEED